MSAIKGLTPPSASPSNGLVSIKTPAEVTAQSEIENQQPNVGDEQIDYGALFHSQLAGQINQDWMRNKMNRQQLDYRLLNCLRMRKGVYSPEELAAIQAGGANSTIYMNIAATKCRALAAWLKEILMAPGDRPFGLEPRHEPKLPDAVMKLISHRAAAKARDMMVQAAQANGGKPMEQAEFEDLAAALQEQFEAMVKKETKRRADGAAEQMEGAIFQKMDDGDFDHAFGEFLEFFSTYPTAFLKGPYMQRGKQLTWGPGWQPIVENEPKLTWKALNPFDAYPAPLARSCQERAFIERLRITEEELYEYIGVDGYNEEAIRWVLSQHQVGLLRNWIWTDAERSQLEGDTNYNWLAQEDLVDALLYWGSISGAVLKAWGVKGATDMAKRYEVCAIMVGSRVIFCQINADPLGRRPYRHASFEPVPGSIWGRGVPELCESQQDVANAAARALVNNMGYASGPQVGVNVDRMPVGEDIESMYPYKIWQFVNDTTGSSGTTNKPLEFFQPASNAEELMNIFDHFEVKADDATGIPRYTYGDEKVQGAGSTMGGLSMLMGAAAKGIRRSVTEVDMRVLAETGYDVFIYEMLNNPDHSIKGDCNIVPRGSAALMIKEQMQTGRQTALQVVGGNPLFSRLVGTKGIADLLRDWLKGLHLPNDLIPEGPELDQLVQQIQQTEAAAAQAPNPAMITAQSNLAVEQVASASKERIAGTKAVTDMTIAGIKHAHQTGQDRGGSGEPTQSKPGLSGLSPAPG